MPGRGAGLPCPALTYSTSNKTATKPPVFWRKKQTHKPCFFSPAFFGYIKWQTRNGTKNPGIPPSVIRSVYSSWISAVGQIPIKKGN